jgi:hypothetical protein
MFVDAEESFKDPPKSHDEQQRLTSERVDRLILWSGRWMEAQLEISGTKSERGAAIKSHIQQLKKYEDGYVQLAGPTHDPNRISVDTLTYHRLLAETQLVREAGGR